MIKNILTILVLSNFLVACAQEPVIKQDVTVGNLTVVEPEVKPEQPKVQPNNNCVNKDRNGNCPPLPNSPRPTPKK